MLSSVSFLTALPAILGIAGFVIYYILKKSVTEDPTVRRIIDKLKFDEPDFENRWSGLTSTQKEALLKDDNELRSKLAVQDRAIMDKVLTNQFRTNIFVYTLSALLLVTSIYFFVKPQPLHIDNIILQNTDSTARDQIVDIDPITITWASSGKDEEVYVILENVATGKQTKRYRALASDGSITFESNNYTNYDKILSNRIPNENNKLRAILYASGESFKSKVFEVKVGTKIICYEVLPNTLKFNAIVDQTIIENFWFSPSIALFRDAHFNGQHIFEAPSYDPSPEITIDSPAVYVSSNMVFGVNPRDIVNAKIYRTDLQSLRDALKALKTNAQKK